MNDTKQARGAHPWRERLLPWVAGAAVGLALATIAISQIKLERAVTEQIRVELNAAGHGWAALETAGRSVALGGTAPSSSAADSAEVD